MRISKSGLEKFKKLYKQQFGEELSDRDALRKASCLLAVIDSVCGGSLPRYKDSGKNLPITVMKRSKGQNLKIHPIKIIKMEKSIKDNFLMSEEGEMDTIMQEALERQQPEYIVLIDGKTGNRFLMSRDAAEAQLMDAEMQLMDPGQEELG